MQVVDGRRCYEWRGWLVRVHEGEIQARRLLGGDWQSVPVDGMPSLDEEITARIVDLKVYWDKDE